MVKTSNPSPEEVAVANQRMEATMSITFELDINGWRTVWFQQAQPAPNRIKPELSIIYYKPVLVIPTAMMPDIDGYVAVSVSSFNTHLVTWLREGAVKAIPFRPCNARSEAWLRQKLALASGYRFREHGFLDKEKIIYTTGD